jgi:hypothetical protein
MVSTAGTDSKLVAAGKLYFLQDPIIFPKGKGCFLFFPPVPFRQVPKALGYLTSPVSEGELKPKN